MLGVGACVVYAVFVRDPSDTKDGNTKRTPTPGWEQLDACSPMQSIDDTRELSFLEDRTVTLEAKEAKTGKTITTNTAAGTWSYDSAGKRYLVTLGQQQHSYGLVQPENSEVCILMYGEIAAANLNESWFGRTLADFDDDRERPDPY